MTTDLEKDIKDIDETVDKAMQAWNVPGLALVIVKDDKILLSKGYGVRDIGRPDKVNEHTLFAIGSNTKAFTATAMGLLVQEENLRGMIPSQNIFPGSNLMTHVQPISSPSVTCYATAADLAPGQAMFCC